MPTDLDARIRALQDIRTFTQVSVFLREELHWPLTGDDLDDENLSAITYDWNAEELGIDPAIVGNMKRLQQFRPFTAEQHWGIFLVQFEGPRLLITQLRRLLSALVRQRRNQTTTSLPAWKRDDLLFIVFTGSGRTVELHFVAFFDEGSRLPSVRTLTWLPHHSPPQYLRRLANYLLPKLCWPDETADTERWRDKWRSAFKLQPGQVIKDASRLADRMARTARDLRDQIASELRKESETDCEEGDSGPFTKLMSEVKERLVADVDVDRFADMCAQTLVYGTLSSRVTDPEGFGSSPIFSAVPLANPFLAALFEQVHDQAATLDLVDSGIEDFVADLRVTDVESILDQFGNSSKGGDPVIHFYEEFLKQYDSDMRADAGAFYTPQPVVDFMVRAVNQVLRQQFHLPAGIADDATWKEASDRNGFKVPESLDPDSPFVTMLDPAAGTGTFLVAWLRHAKSSYGNAGGTSDGWTDHLRRVVLPQMHAFELMLGPYAITHLKVAMELLAQGIDHGGATILLTDTLEYHGKQIQIPLAEDPLAAEGQRAAELKESKRFTVVIGNPPYDRVTGDAGKRKGGVVRHGSPGLEALLSKVIEPMSQAGLGVHVKNLYNDYVYFWRWAEWQATELPKGPGVVVFITASSYLQGVSMGGLRHLLRSSFDDLWIIDLGGEGRGALTEDNVFDIQTPVAIAIAVCKGSEATETCNAHYYRVLGTRSEKFSQLEELSLDDISQKVPGQAMDPLTPRSPNQYYDWPEVTDLFPWIRSGSKFQRTWPIAESHTLLRRRWRELVSAIPRHRLELLKETRDRNTTTTPLPLLRNETRLVAVERLDREDLPESYQQYGYRSFDRQWVIADHRLADMPGPLLWQVRGSQQVYLTTLTSTNLGNGPAATATPYVPDLDHFRGSYGAKSIMPLYRDGKGSEPNIAAGLVDALGKHLGLPVNSEDVAAYVYGLCGTPAFCEQFAGILAERAGPVHIPMTAESELFQRAIELGRDLLWWHTWGERFAPPGATGLPAGETQQIKPVEGMPEKFAYDPSTGHLTVGTGVFAPVSPEVWDFQVSGLEVLRSWLGYRMKKRKGRRSSPLDDIRPTRWTQSEELLRVLAILQHTVDVTPTAKTLLSEILDSPLIPTSSLPTPQPHQRKPPKKLT
ncbi:type ISP restriction/modification enzyme [Candidatus Poriferisocius sp.]|uniref:type ISP restriction/modification enzyme n=1 Tax=Candidatus Poriferisocius sp. TaxID=3101276 RepID=UPI003B58BB88